MSGATTVPGFPKVRARASGCYNYIEYFGTAEELIAAGAATAEMLALAGNKRSRVDADGDEYDVVRYFRFTNGQPYRYFRIRRRKGASGLLESLPGAAEAIAAHQRYEAECEARLAAPPLCEQK
jgi:hypothetical protein